MSITPLTPIALPQAPNSMDDAAPAVGSGGAVFGQILHQLLAGSSQTAANANKMVQSLITGDADNLHAVTLAVQQADISFRLILEFSSCRNRGFREC